jgi:hypothetical protein
MAFRVQALGWLVLGSMYATALLGHTVEAWLPQQ